MTHPYTAFDGSRLWQVIDNEIASLEANGDLRLTTARQYVIGSLCKALISSGAVVENAPAGLTDEEGQGLKPYISPVFLRAREIMEPILASRRFTVAHDFNSPQSFGSAYIEYAGGHRRVKLVWDGKERFLTLLGTIQHNLTKQPTDWHSLVDEESPLQVEQGASAEAWIGKLATGLRRFLSPAV